ncbi:nuclear transport factor 2 family protein [Paraburkholderia bannensis]|nr:nuclear transport factor 2 family protein [Paraburkholderia bannensis]
MNPRRTSRVRMRTTLVIARNEGAWKIRQRHFSAPPLAPPF